MKRFGLNIILIICLTILSLGMAACQKDSINGKLDGQWQIMKIEKLSDGSVEIPASGKYICIYLHVVNLNPSSGYMGRPYSGNMSYDKKTGVVTIDFPYNTGDNASQLAPWGIYSNPVVFHVETVDNKQLVLRSESTIVTCRRY